MTILKKRIASLLSTIAVSQPISNLSVGDKVKTTWEGADLVFLIADKNHTGYPANSVTLITKEIHSFKAFDGKEINSYYSGNSLYGNNLYTYSNILQWLNKSGHSWYVATFDGDAPPSSTNVQDGINPYDTTAGFLTGFNSTFLGHLLYTVQISARATTYGEPITVNSKVFIPSTTEVGLPDESGYAEGSKLALFNSISRVALNANAAAGWWLRTPFAGNTNVVRITGTDGSLCNAYAYCGGGGVGVRPAMNVNNAMQISLIPDANGVYTIL